MSLIRMMIVITSVLAGVIGHAQTTAEAYFNQASREYVKEDKMKALRTVDQGLQHHPGDPRLLKLAEELVKEQEQQKQKQDQQKKDQQDQQQQKDQQSKDRQKQEQQKSEQERQQEQQEREQKAGQDQQQTREQEAQPKAGNIAPRDAMRMLDALERSEKDVQEKVRVKRRPAVRRTIEKDW